MGRYQFPRAKTIVNNLLIESAVGQNAENLINSSGTANDFFARIHVEGFKTALLEIAVQILHPVLINELPDSRIHSKQFDSRSSRKP